MRTIRTIDDVLEELTDIVDYAWQQNSRLGYFPAMYRKVTAKVKEGVETGQFHDGERLERLDVVFARRYIEAFHQHRRGEPTTRSWAYSFEMARREHPMIVQHLLLGMNAHINLDLGIAASEVCRDADLAELKDDFFHINEILAGLLDEVQHGVGLFSPLLGWLDRLGGRTDEAICDFSIRKARQAAWNKAQALHALDPAHVPAKVGEIDAETSLLARVICPPTEVANLLFRPIRDAEDEAPRQVIEALR